MPKFQAVLPDALGCCTSRYGPMVFPVGDAYVGRSLALYHEYSEGEVELFRQMVRPGDTVVEAGANMGALTIPLARLVGPTGRVVAIEPQRAMHAILTANVVLNGQFRVACERMALGSRDGEIHVPDIPVGAAVNFGGLSMGGESGEACPLRRLDSLDLPRLRLLKADVEGAETDVLLGAAETIRRLRPILYLENDRPDKSAGLIRAVQDLGYRLWWHAVPLFNPGNYADNADNVFANLISLNMVCAPSEWELRMDVGQEILSPDTPHPFSLR